MRKVVAKGYLVKDSYDVGKNGYRGTTNTWGQTPQMFSTKAGAVKASQGKKVVRAILVAIED